MKLNIPKLTKKERRMWIKALKGTLKRYKNEESHTSCLLCQVSNGCSNCIWMWFTDTWCINYRNKYLTEDPEGAGSFLNPRWIKLRLRQIPQWIKKLEAGL